MERRKRRAKKNKNVKVIVISILLLGIIAGGVVIYNKIDDNNQKKIEEEQRLEAEEGKKKQEEEEKNKLVKTEVVISAAGDCTLGTDTKFNQATSLPTAVKNVGNDYSYLFKNVYDIFSKDDYTIVNLENPFTDATTKKDKGTGTVFHFKGPKEYVNILTKGGIEGVTISNNHIYDYGKQGFEDTVATLKDGNVEFFGEGYKILTDVKGIKFGFLGYQGWNDTKELRNKIKSDIDELRSQGASVVIPYFHWGVERESKPNETQKNLARYSIDSGADMVLGSHPHVIQSMENYKGKLIAYSLANFSFGGNSNPSDKRTFILQMKFNFENEKVVDTSYKVIPTSISSVDYKNDYKPTPASGDMRVKILNDLNALSPSLNGEIKDDFFKLK
ncbi:MAG: CapA family protein [Clostridium sp.]